MHPAIVSFGMAAVLLFLAFLTVSVDSASKTKQCNAINGHVITDVFGYFSSCVAKVETSK